MVAILSMFLLAGMIKGIVGLGLPTVAMGLMALTMPSTSAAADPFFRHQSVATVCWPGIFIAGTASWQLSGRDTDRDAVERRPDLGGRVAMGPGFPGGNAGGLWRVGADCTPPACTRSS